MHFYLSRRHRRKLFFPPGLLALAGLLWLGVLALEPWRERLGPRHVMELTMPINLPQSEEFSLRFLLPNPKTVCKTCSWTDIYLTNENPAIDKRERMSLTNAIRAIVRDSGRDAGVRIHLMPGARYQHLIFALDAVEQGNIRKHWLDIHHSPTTLYAFVDHPPVVLDDLGCLLCNDVMYSDHPMVQKPFWGQLGELVTAFWQFEWAERRYQLLQQPEWRWPVALLAAIAALSSWHIVRAWRTA